MITLLRKHLDRILAIIVLGIVITFGAIQCEKTNDCVLDTRQAADNWLEEWIDFLENLESQQSAQPLINTAKIYQSELRDCD
jgi:hypothetical protein